MVDTHGNLNFFVKFAVYLSLLALLTFWGLIGFCFLLETRSINIRHRYLCNGSFYTESELYHLRALLCMYAVNMYSYNIVHLPFSFFILLLNELNCG